MLHSNRNLHPTPFEGISTIWAFLQRMLSKWRLPLIFLISTDGRLAPVLQGSELDTCPNTWEAWYKRDSMFDPCDQFRMKSSKKRIHLIQLGKWEGNFQKLPSGKKLFWHGDCKMIPKKVDSMKRQEPLHWEPYSTLPRPVNSISTPPLQINPAVELLDHARTHACTHCT